MAASLNLRNHRLVVLDRFLLRSIQAFLDVSPGETIVFWYHMPRGKDVPVVRRPPPFQPLADFFGLWHEYERGEQRQV